MKRFLIILTALSIILLAGCAVPTGKDDAADQSATTAVEATGGVLPESGTEAAASTSQTASVNSGGNADNGGSTDTGVKAATEAVTAKLPVTVYYQDSDGYLVPMTRWIEKQEGIARAAVSGLIDSAITREEIQYYGVYPVLPVNTDVQGIDIKDRIATIDFNKSLLGYENQASERNLVASVVYTLTEFSTIDGVRILVNGYPQKTLKYGTDISGILSRKNVYINSAGAIGVNDSAKADIYWFKRANEGFTYLIPVSVGYGAAGGELGPEVLVNLLLGEKPDEKLQSEMPPDAKLLGSSEGNGILTLNFDAAFLKYGGTAKEEGILKQLAYTLKQLKGQDRIKIQVEGEPAELPEGTDISRGLDIPKTINDYIDR
jgi:germination protein M